MIKTNDNEHRRLLLNALLEYSEQIGCPTVLLEGLLCFYKVDMSPGYGMEAHGTQRKLHYQTSPMEDS